MKVNIAKWPKRAVAAILAVLLAITFLPFSNFNLVTAKADVGDPPAHSKSRSDNGDGTYKIELTVTGDADDQTEGDSHVNVMIVYDESSSMTNGTGSGNRNRADYAEDAVYSLVNGLVGYQNQGIDIYMAEVGFGTGVNTRTNWTDSLTTIRSHYDEGVDGTITRNAHGNYGYNGTAWAAALDRADSLLDNLTNVNGQDRSGYPTFVILVTDGGPTVSPGNQTTTPGPNVPWTNYRVHYLAAAPEARAIQSRSNTTLYGIYAFGTDANLLDDLMYYANTNTHRTVNGYSIQTATQTQHNFGNDEGADYYYNASNSDALNQAIEDIFSQIVEAMGITEVSISDGTTSAVTASSGEVTNLLGVDEDSYQYWMSIPVDSSNQFKRTKNVNGVATEITYTVNGGTVTWTEGGASKSVTLNGSVKNGQFKFEWTQDDFPNDLYEYAPNDAELVNGAVEWDLSNVEVLLDGVTYSVTFDVYPSQTALDYKARLDNGEAYDDVVDADLQDYFHKDGSLETNTGGSVTYSDSRDGSGPNTTEFVNPPAVATTSSSMTVEKEWEGASAPSVELNLDILMDGDEENPFYVAKLNSADGWEATFNISAGMIVDGEALPDAMGHDFSFAELDDTQYRWELHAPTVRPMIIDGADEPTILIKEDVENGYDSSGKTTYTIDGKTYYVDPAISTLTATNHRRSNLNLTKVVTGEGADPDALFPFTLQVNNIKAPETEPTDDPEHNSDYWVWFSIIDAEDNPVTTAAGVSNATPSGNYFYAKSGDSITLNMKAGWNLRFTNLPSGSTYSFTEGDASGFKFISAENTGAADDTFEADGKTATGTIVTYNANAYEVTFTNDYAETDITVDKVWVDDSDAAGARPDELELTLNGAPANTEIPDPEITESDDGNTWTYTWAGLPKYDSAGEEIEYTVTEETVPAGYQVSGSPAEDGGEITNRYVLVDISVNKVWDDNGDQDGVRPGSLTLTVNGAPEGTAIPDPTINKSGNTWTYTWTGLPKYDGDEEIEYTVTEENVPEDYTCETTTVANGETITNVHTLETIDLTIVKEWDDDDDRDGLRPESLEFYLSDGIQTDPVATVTLPNDEGEWTATVEGLPKKSGGQDINYTWTEDEDSLPTGYELTKTEPSEDGLTTTLTNSYEPEEISVTVTKTWSDGGDVDGVRPDELTLTLNAPDDVEVPDPTITEDGDNWTYVWADLPKKSGGEDIEYTVTEENVPEGYTCETPTVANGGTITNVHTPEEIEVTVEKEWEDNDDQLGMRPSTLSVTLLQDGETYGTYELTADDEWTLTVDGLPKNKKDDEGETVEIEYTWEETVPEGYEQSDKSTGDNVTTFTNTLNLGDLIIEKDLTKYNNFVNQTVSAEADPVTFIYRVTASLGSWTFDDYVSLTFDGAGTDSIEFEEVFPVGAEVTIVEVYSGAGYKNTGESTVTVKITDPADTTAKVATANFKNAYDNKIKNGWGIQNHYSDGKYVPEETLR